MKTRQTLQRARPIARLARMAIVVAVAAAGVLSTLPAFAQSLDPAKSWLSVWSAAKNEAASFSYAQVTRARLFNPADPSDPASPTAQVTVTYYQYGCWGQAAARETLVVPPGQYNGFSSLFAAWPGQLFGTGCLSIKSDVPVVPVNGHIQEGFTDQASGHDWRRAVRTDFWPVGKKGALAWSSYWEHATPLGGPQYGGRFTGGFVLNPVRQVKGAPPVPTAHVTVTHRVGACTVGAVWLTETFELQAGQLKSFVTSSSSNATAQGCVTIVSDQPVVAFNGAIYDVGLDPASGEQRHSRVAVGYQAMGWLPPD
jgi:hypothetical protein